MAFKIKDLMIHVLDPKAAQAGLCRIPSVQCTAPNSLCTAIHSICWPRTICPPITICETLPTVVCQHVYSVICPGGTACGVNSCPPASICINPSHCGVVGSCGLHTPCPGGSCAPIRSICTFGTQPTIFDPTIYENPDPTAGLATLKEQLKQAMANVETQEAALNDSLLPQTVAEAEDLETRLQGALDALKARKADLQKSEAKKK